MRWDFLSTVSENEREKGRQGIQENTGEWERKYFDEKKVTSSFEEEEEKKFWMLIIW